MIFVNYLIFGLGFYIGLCLSNLETFDDTDFIDGVRGFLLGFVFWPVGIAYLVHTEYNRRKRERQ